MAFGKRQLILAALIMALGAAVYLNWQFTGNNELLATNVVEPTKELGEAKYVNNVQATSPVSDKEFFTLEDDVQPTNTAATSTNTEYFAKAQENRQKARSEATDMVKEILNDIKTSEEAKAEAVKQAAEVAKNIQQEANIESLIKAKGFSECIAFIQNGECSVVVSANGLNESTAITIKDIVSGQAGIPYDKIKITEAK